MKTCLLLLLSLFVAGAVVSAQKLDEELASVVETEYAFSRTAGVKGIRDSFIEFLADDGIMFRPGPVNGKEWFRNQPSRPGVLSWYPIVAGISGAGDMGYTTGPWEFRPKSADEKPVAHGFFATVWKKQPDGKWRFAIDIGTSNPPPATTAPKWQPPKDFGKNVKKSVAKASNEAEKAALKNLESELSKAATARGTAGAYETFVAVDARLYRENEFPFAGREATLAALAAKPGVMAWQLAGMDVAHSGDLGYTYGSYEFKGKGATGETVEKGHFMRIWRKQSDGVWKIVLDITNPLPPPAAAS